jgi:hypothetical protein
MLLPPDAVTVPPVGSRSVRMSALGKAVLGLTIVVPLLVLGLPFQDVLEARAWSSLRATGVEAVGNLEYRYTTSARVDPYHVRYMYVVSGQTLVGDYPSKFLYDRFQRGGRIAIVYSASEPQVSRPGSQDRHHGRPHPASAHAAFVACLAVRIGNDQFVVSAIQVCSRVAWTSRRG